jgi:hypothetical protein
MNLHTLLLNGFRQLFKNQQIPHSLRKMEGFADPHPLNLVLSIFCKIMEGGESAIYAGNGPPTGPPTVVFGGSGGEYGPDGMFGAIIGWSRR